MADRVAPDNRPRTPFVVRYRTMNGDVPQHDPRISLRSIRATFLNKSFFVIPAKAGLWRQDAGTNIRAANGPEGVRLEPHVIQCL
jgi:hypothetical protein